MYEKETKAPLIHSMVQLYESCSTGFQIRYVPEGPVHPAFTGRGSLSNKSSLASNVYNSMLCAST